MTRTLALMAVLLTAGLTPPGAAERLAGRVVGVADGDTITVLDATHAQHKIRLAGIDAPERGQRFGQRSKQHLSDLVYRQDVLVEWNKRDRYGRIVGKVLVGPVDAGLEQIRLGLAWWFRKYAEEQTPKDRRAYADAVGGGPYWEARPMDRRRQIGAPMGVEASAALSAFSRLCI